VSNIDDFKKELKALLAKYNVTIDFEADDCSDWHGITGEKMVVCEKNGITHVLANYQHYIEAGDL